MGGESCGGKASGRPKAVFNDNRTMKLACCADTQCSNH